jgi:hypothetical protein
MGIDAEYLSIDLTIEQAAAVRAILKLEYIYTLGEWLKTSRELPPILQLQSSLFFTDRWAGLDRPFGHAMLNRVLSNESLKLDSIIPIRMSELERELLADLIFTGHYRATLDNSKADPETYVKSFVALVLIDRNIEALKKIFTIIEKKDEPKAPAFWFEQVSPKGVVN